MTRHHQKLELRRAKLDNFRKLLVTRSAATESSALPRQTDHTWVEMRACLLHQEQAAGAIIPRPGGDFEEAAWHPLTAKVINNVASNQARLVRKALEPLKDAGRLDAETAEILLAKTG